MNTPAEHRRPWARTLIAPALILIWLAVLMLGGPFFGRISDVSTNQQSSFLPQSAESTQVADRADDFTEDPFLPAVAVAQRDDGLTDQDRQWAQEISDSLVDRGIAEQQPSPHI